MIKGQKHKDMSIIKMKNSLKGRIAWNKGVKFKKIEEYARNPKNRSVKRIKELELIAGRKKPECCELCGRKLKICFDHDHNTGKFRGWICVKCNVALGMVEDNIQTLELMMKYIIKNN